MSVINTNVKSILAQNALVTNDRSLTKSMQPSNLLRITVRSRR